jgi:hypothetical protein
MRKWPGVKGWRSLGSEDMGVMGREFKHASILFNNVFISLNVKFEFPRILLKCPLTDLTLISHKSPIWGDLGGIKCHFIPSFAAMF